MQSRSTSCRVHSCPHYRWAVRELDEAVITLTRTGSKWTASITSERWDLDNTWNDDTPRSFADTVEAARTFYKSLPEEPDFGDEWRLSRNNNPTSTSGGLRRTVFRAKHGGWGFVISDEDEEQQKIWDPRVYGTPGDAMQAAMRHLGH